jgi:tetraacyldisaccharide 4'-kinase
VSIGNLAMGGRGKTPLAGLTARLLVDAGERPAILSRGYGRRRPVDGVVVVSDGIHVLADLDRSGDEPLMLARATPGAAVLVHEIRAVSAALAERALGVTVHVLDDGFQHASLVKDVDVVVIAPEDLSARRIPFGRLRSPVSALARAHAVIVDGPLDDRLRGRLEAVRSATAEIFTLRRDVGSPVPLEPDRPWPPGPGPVVAVAGIAKPRRFIDALQATGWDVRSSMAFGDHHRYRRRDVARVARVVQSSGAQAVLTTEKDAVRLLPLRPLPVPMAAVPLQVAVQPPARFREWLLHRLSEARQ